MSAWQLLLIAAVHAGLVGLVLGALELWRAAGREMAADMASSPGDENLDAFRHNAAKVECTFQVRAYTWLEEGMIEPDAPIDGDVIECDVDEELGLAVFHVHKKIA